MHLPAARELKQKSVLLLLSALMCLDAPSRREGIETLLEFRKGFPLKRLDAPSRREGIETNHQPRRGIVFQQSLDTPSRSEGIETRGPQGPPPADPASRYTFPQRGNCEKQWSVASAEWSARGESREIS